MILLRNKRSRYIVIAAVVAVFSTMMVYMVQAGTTDTGSDPSQPVVAGVDYVDAKVNDLTTKINDLTAKITDLTSKNNDLTANVTDLTSKNSNLTANVTDLTSKNSDLTAKVTDLTAKNSDLAATVDKLQKQLQSGQTGSAGFETLNVKAGQKVIGGASTQMILRTGQAKAIAVNGMGVSDLTGGKDLQTNISVVTNHLLLIPRDDGRGIKAVTDIWIMISGTYTIE